MGNWAEVRGEKRAAKRATRVKDCIVGGFTVARKDFGR